MYQTPPFRPTNVLNTTDHTIEMHADKTGQAMGLLRRMSARLMMLLVLFVDHHLTKGHEKTSLFVFWTDQYAHQVMQYAHINIQDHSPSVSAMWGPNRW